MTRHWASLITVLVLLTTSVHGKDKKKILPAYVLQAQTVLVVVDPEAGISPLDPNANGIAQQNVEKASDELGTVYTRHGRANCGFSYFYSARPRPRGEPHDWRRSERSSGARAT